VAVFDSTSMGGRGRGGRMARRAGGCPVRPCGDEAYAVRGCEAPREQRRRNYRHPPRRGGGHRIHCRFHCRAVQVVSIKTRVESAYGFSY